MLKLIEEQKKLIKQNAELIQILKDVVSQLRDAKYTILASGIEAKLKQIKND